MATNIYTNPENIISQVGTTLNIEVVISDGSSFISSVVNSTIATRQNNTNSTITLTTVAIGSTTLTIMANATTINVPITVVADNNDYSGYGNDTSMGDNVPLDPTPDEITGDDLEAVQDDLQIIQELYPDPDDDAFIFGRNLNEGITGINSKDLGIIVGQVTIPMAPSVSENNQNVSGMYGQHWLGNNYGAKTFNIPITIPAGPDEQYYRDTLENIANTLIQLDNEEQQLVFGEWSDRTYYGHFTTLSDPAFINLGSWDATATLTFVASDPKGYLEQEIEQADGAPYQLSVKGNAESYPIIQYNFQGDVKQFGYSTEDATEGVMVGFADEATDTKPLAFVDKFQDINTLTSVKEISKIGFAIPNGDVAGSGTVAMSWSGDGVKNDKFYDSDWSGYDYFPNTTKQWGNLLLTKTFDTTVAPGVHNFETATSALHVKYYSRALQRIEFYMIGADGKRYARYGIRDRGEGWMPHAYMLVGRNTKEEEDNLAKGIGYDKPGNGAYAWSLNNYKGKTTNVKIHSDVATQSNLSVDRRENYTLNSTLYSGYGNLHWNSNRVVMGKKTVRTYLTETTYATPRDSNGKKTGPQQKQFKIIQNDVRTYDVPLNKIVNKKGKNSSQKLELNSSQQIDTRTTMWGNTIGDTTTWESKFYDRVWTQKKGWFWQESKHTKEVKYSANTTRKTENLLSGTNYNLSDAHNSSVFSNIFALFRVSVKNKVMHFTVSQLDGRGWEIPNSVVADAEFSLPYDIPLNQLGIYFGKQLIVEDKRINNSRNTIKPYQDDWLEVTNYSVNKLLDGYDPNEPRIIARAGDVGLINTETEDVYINGSLVNELRSIQSTFPAMNGGHQEQFNFIPNPAEADIKLTYRPSMR